MIGIALRPGKPLGGGKARGARRLQGLQPVFRQKQAFLEGPALDVRKEKRKTRGKAVRFLFDQIVFGGLPGEIIGRRQRLDAPVEPEGNLG